MKIDTNKMKTMIILGKDITHNVTIDGAQI